MKGGSIALGLKGMLHDIGIECGVVLCTDAAAAKGISSRRGLGKVRHIELCELWLQDQVARGKISVHRVDGSSNYSDSLTKAPSAERVMQTMHSTSQEFKEGRHEIMPHVAQ